MSDERFRHNVPRLFLGLMVIAVGVLFTLDRLGYVNAGDFWEYWPVLLIAAGIGRVIQPAAASSGTAKCALSFLTRLLGAEFAPRVRVNAINVGAVRTDALTSFLSEESLAQMAALTPMRRIGEVEDIAIMALYLASPASSFVTGKVYDVDGGMEATNLTPDMPRH